MDKLGQLSLDKLSLDKVKNMVGEVRDRVSARNDTEKRVYEALSNKNWGASSTMLNDIARDTYDHEKYRDILPLIWTTMESPSREWRKVFKALLLLEHLVKNGAERIIEEARDHLHRLRMLSDFNYYEGAADKGTGVREKSKQLIEFLKDNDLIREEREKSRKLRDKYVGLGGGGGGGGYSGSGYSGGSYRGGSYSESGIGSLRDEGAYSKGGYSGGGGATDRYSDLSDRRGEEGGYSGTIAKGKYSDVPAKSSGKSSKSEGTENDSKRKKDKKPSATKLEIKIKDKGASGSSKASRSSGSAASPTPAPTTAVPDLLGGDLLSGGPSAAAPNAATSVAGKLGDLFATAPVSASTTATANGFNAGFDGFDPRDSVSAAQSPAAPFLPTSGAVLGSDRGSSLLEQDFAAFSTAPLAAAGFQGGGGGASDTSVLGKPFSASPAAAIDGGRGGLMNNGLDGHGGSNNGGARTGASSNGVDEFSDFQGSSPVIESSNASVVTSNGGTVAAGISNPKWRDVSALVDLGGLTSNTDKKVAQLKVVEQTFQSNNNSFAGLDGFHAPRGQSMGMGMSRPISGMGGQSGANRPMSNMGRPSGMMDMRNAQQVQHQGGGWMGQSGGMRPGVGGGWMGGPRGDQQFIGQKGVAMSGQMKGGLMNNDNIKAGASEIGGTNGSGGLGTMPGGFF